LFGKIAEDREVLEFQRRLEAASQNCSTVQKLKIGDANFEKLQMFCRFNLRNRMTFGSKQQQKQNLNNKKSAIVVCVCLSFASPFLKRNNKSLQNPLLFSVVLKELYKLKVSDIELKIDECNRKKFGSSHKSVKLEDEQVGFRPSIEM
jgi:sulfite reductase alpha subunit-like flavoprotein